MLLYDVTWWTNRWMLDLVLWDNPGVDDFVADVDVSPVVLLGDDDVNPVWESVLTNQYNHHLDIKQRHGSTNKANANTNKMGNCSWWFYDYSVYIYIYNWLVVWNMAFIFPYIGNVIIPTDEVHHFSEGLAATTNQIRCWLHYLSNPHDPQRRLRGTTYVCFVEDRGYWRCKYMESHWIPLTWIST